MASDQTLRAIITVLDKTSEPIRQINARFAAMSSPLRQISSRVAELGELTGIKNIGEDAKNAFEKVAHLGEGLLEMAGPLAALGAAGSLAGVIEIAKSTGEWAEQLDIGAKITGMATERLAGWHYAAGLVNLDAAQLDKGFTYLNRNINEAASGKAKDVERILGHMGFHNTPGHLVSTADALKAVAAEAKHLVDTGQIQAATDMMSKLFGLRAGPRLLPLFEQGSEALQKVFADAQEAGISLTAAQTAAGHGFMEQFKGMQASVEGLKIAIGNDLFPVLTPVIQAMREWMNANREWLAAKVDVGVRYLSDELKSINWKSVVNDMKEVAAAAKWIVHEVGGVGPAIAILVGISFAPTILAFTQLGAAVAVAAAKFVVFPVAALLASFISLAPAITSARDAMAALSLAMDANPIGVAVLVIGTLIGIGYEVYEHWSGISKFFKDLWAGLPDWAKTGLEIFGAVLAPFIALPVVIMDHWRVIIDFFKDLWNGIKLPSWLSGPTFGGYQDAAHHWHPGAPATAGAGQPPLSTLPGAAAAAGAAPAQPNGSTKVTVDFKNLPPGASVSTESRGNADPPVVNVGPAFAY